MRCEKKRKVKSFEPKLLLKMELPLTEKGSWLGIEAGRDQSFGSIWLSLRYSCLNVETPGKTCFVERWVWR